MGPWVGMPSTVQASVRPGSLMQVHGRVRASWVEDVFVAKGPFKGRCRSKLANHIKEAEVKIAEVEVKELWMLHISIFVGCDTGAWVSQAEGRQEVVNGDGCHRFLHSKPISRPVSRVWSGPDVRLQPRRPKKICVGVVMLAFGTESSGCGTG